jgi:regulatory protein
LKDIRDAAMSYIEHRPRTKKEMRDHLEKKGYEENEIQDVIALMEKAHYMSDASYSAQFMKYGFDKGWSYFRVRMELEKRGVSEQDIEAGRFDYEDEYDVDIDEEDEKRALGLAEKFAAAEDITDRKSMGKLQRRLAGFGYGRSTIYHVTETIYNRYGKEDPYD